MSISVTEKSISKKVKQGERVIIVENIKYPQFEGDKHKKLCKRMNDFYKSVAEKYSSYAERKLIGGVKRGLHKSDVPFSIGMKYKIALCDEKIVSVVLDLVFAQGKSVKCRRFTQMWSCEKEDIIRLNEIIRTDRRSKKKIYTLVLEAAKRNGKNPAFGYFEDYLKRLSAKFDISNCFIAPKGLCFFINAGILSPSNHGADTFVLSRSALQDVICGDFLPQNDENEPPKANIVNNI